MHLLLSLLPYVFIAAIGASLGSFYRALGDRILSYFYGQERKSLEGKVRRTLPLRRRWMLVLTHPSSCSHCNARISVSRLIPVVGWFVARGRCEHCGAAISSWHPVTEALFAALGVVFLYFTQSAVGTLLLLLFVGHLLVAMNTDWHRLTLDYENTALLLVVSAASVWVPEGTTELLLRLYAGLGVGAFFLIAYIVTKGRQPGFGDILLGAVLGFHHGFPWLLVLLQIGAVGSLLHLWLVKSDMRSAAPLGFYMAVGSVITTVATLVLG